MKKEVSVDELLKLIPDDFLTDLVDQYDVDRYVSKLKGGLMFKLLLYSQLAHNQLSLRLMSEAYNSALFQCLVPQAQGKVVHSGIQDRLKKIPNDFFKAIYERVHNQLSQHYQEPTLKKYHLKRYDSTLIRASARLLCGRGLRLGVCAQSDKRNIKLSTEMLNDGLIRMQIFDQQRYTSEDNALGQTIKQATHQAGQVIVFDRGLKDRKIFIELDQNAQQKEPIHFVSRIYSNSKITPIKPHPDSGDWPSPDLELIEDTLGYVHQGRHSKKVDIPFRVIKFKRVGDDKPVVLLTNIIQESAWTITQIYKKRWDIEVLFRFLKQEINLSHIICHHPQAMQNVIYILLIAAMLVLIYRNKNRIKSYRIAKKRFFKELQEIIIYNMICEPKSLDLLKHMLKHRIQKE